jgi:2-methylisocitrate lyase-like PEP mutase family enzyme
MDLCARCERLRSLHVPGDPLVLPNAWDVATAKVIADAGFPVVATTSGGVAGSLGYEDHQGAPAEEMLAAAARICGSLDVPVTVDAEAGYGMEPAELVAALKGTEAAGCNLEDTDHAASSLRDPFEQAEWLRQVREAASDQDYDLVVNARIDVFLATRGQGGQGELLPDALRRAHAYFDAGVDCVYPIALWEADPLAAFISEVGGPINVLAIPNAPSVPQLAELGAARISWGTMLHWQAMEQFKEALTSLATSSEPA